MQNAAATFKSETGRYAVTSDEIVYGDLRIPIQTVEFAAARIHRDLKMSIVMAVIGLLIFNFFKGFWAFIGVLLLPGAFYFYKYMVDCTLFVTRKDGSTEIIEVSSQEILRNMDVAIEQQLAMHKSKEQPSA